MHGGSAGRECHDTFLQRFLLLRRCAHRINGAVDEILKVFLESVHIRAQRHHPISVESLFDILLFNARTAHVREAKINTIS